jgi:ADP-heptose:LPS heptosyltransferase
LAGVLRCLPVLEALQAAGRPITFLAQAPHLELVRGTACADQFWERSAETRDLVKALRAAGFEEAVVLDEAWASAWLAKRAGIPRRWGVAGFPRSLLLRPAVQKATGSWPGAEAFRPLLAAMDVPRPASWSPSLTPSAQTMAQAAEVLEMAQIPAAEGTLVGLIPASDEPAAALWPWRSYAALAQALRRRNPAVRLVILATASDLWPAVRIHEETARFLPVLGPNLEWLEKAALLRHLRLVVGSDSGLLHLTAAVGVPCLALLSRRAADDRVPSGAEHRVLRGRGSGPPPFFSHGRPRLQGLAVESVLRVCEEMLGR